MKNEAGEAGECFREGLDSLAASMDHSPDSPDSFFPAVTPCK